MAPRRTRKRATIASFDLYARAMLDHWLGKKVVFEFERDDGYRSRSAVDAYFAPPAKWSKVEREAMREVRGRVLDVGCGPGRHALYLQRKRHRVVGIDASPTQVALARIRGVEEVYQGSASHLPRGLGKFDTIILMGNNFGLAGDLPRMRKFLREARQITTARGRILGSTRIPGTWIPQHMPYVKWNIARGRPPGLLTLRGRYEGRIGDWFDLLLLAPDDFAQLAYSTGWDLVRVIYEPREDAASYVGVLQRR